MTYVCGGKNGDLLNLAPILQQEFRETGIAPHLVTTKQYGGLAKAFPNLKVTEIDCHFDHLGILVREAKKLGKVDFIPQCHSVGSYPQSKRVTPSFCLEAWEKCGRLHQWRELTLELPRNPKHYGWHTRCQDSKFIVFADHSQSSPFPNSEDIFLSLKKEFPSHEIIRMSSLRFENILDSLQLFDWADLIVSIDTCWLHLSRACKTPVIALVTDVPSTWHGSAWHPRFAMHCRYADYELRKSELLWTAKEILKTS